MGACCSGKDNKKGENQEEEIYTQTSRINSFGENMFNKIKPSIELEIETSSLSKNLTCIIKKIINDEFFPEDIKISKCTMEYLWNVYRFYLDDHMDSNFLIYDYRENTLKSENFIKKFKQINYKIEQMRNFTNAQFQKFKKFIKDKSIIIIAKEDSIITIEEFIYLIIENKISSKIYLLDYNLATKSSLNLLNSQFLEAMDYPNFSKMPFVFLSLRFFPHLKSESLIFLEFIDADKLAQISSNNNSNNNQNIISNNNLICDRKYKENDFYESKILNFFKNFKISLNLKLNINSNHHNSDNECIGNNSNKNNNKKYHNINTRSIKDQPSNSNKNNAEKQTSNYASPNTFNYLIKCFEISNIIDLDDLAKKKDIIIDYLEIIKQEIALNKSLIIQIPLDIDKEAILAVLLYLVWKITNIEPINLTAYLKEILFYFPAVNTIKEEAYEKIFKFLQTNFGMENKLENSIIVKSTFYNSIRGRSYKHLNNNPSSSSSSNPAGSENENFQKNSTYKRFSGMDSSSKKRSSQFMNNINFSNNFYFNHSNEEKSEEEKEKIKKEISELQSKVK